MAVTYEPIATTTVSGSSTTNVTFNSIPATYTDLVIVATARSDRASTIDDIGIQFNGDTTSANYSSIRLFGNGTTATSDIQNLIPVLCSGANAATGDFSVATINIMNYANSTTYKTIIARGNPITYALAVVGLWDKTPEAINSIKLTPVSGGTIWVAGSTFTLYGIKAA